MGDTSQAFLGHLLYGGHGQTITSSIHFTRLHKLALKQNRFTEYNKKVLIEYVHHVLILIKAGLQVELFVVKKKQKSGWVEVDVANFRAL